MAYVTDEEQDPNAPKPGQEPPIGTAAPTGAIGTSSNNSPQGTAAPQAQAPSSRMANFQRIMDANRGLGQGMADRIAGGIQTKGQSVYNNMNAARTAYGQNLQGAVPTNLHVASPFQYRGPTSMTEGGGIDTGKITGQIGDLAQDLNATQDFAGRQALLQREYGKGRAYTQGMSSLDASIMGDSGNLADPNAQYGKGQARPQGGAFERLRNQYGGLGQQWQDDQVNAVGQADNARKATEKAEADRQLVYAQDENSRQNTEQNAAKNRAYEGFMQGHELDTPEWQKKILWQYVNDPSSVNMADPRTALALAKFRKLSKKDSADAAARQQQHEQDNDHFGRLGLRRKT